MEEWSFHFLKNVFSCLELGRLQEELVYGDSGSRTVISNSVFDALNLEILLDIQMEMLIQLWIYESGLQERDLG